MNGTVQVPHVARTWLTIVITVAVLRYAQDVFVPLALAILLTFLLAPLVEALQGLRINRAVAVVISVVVAMLVIGALVYVVFNQFSSLAAQLPDYRRQLHANLTHLQLVVRGGVAQTTHAVEQFTKEINRVAPSGLQPLKVPKVQVVEAPPNAMESLRSFAAPLVKPVSTVALVIVFVIFMLLRLPDLRDRVIRLLGARNLRVTTAALDDAARRVSRFLVMQTLINGFQGLCVTAGLSLIGMPNAILWGALTVALRFIPYVGVWIAAAMPVALSFAVFDQWQQPALVVALYLGLELLSYIVLEPCLYGAGTGVSPIALLVAAAFWGWLWGPIGLLLAIPITVCLVVLGKYVPQLAFLHVLLGDQPVLHEHERLYQRLLASNHDEADELIEESLLKRSNLDLCDAVIVPALQLAEDDHDRGLFGEGKRLMVFEHIDEWADEFATEGAALAPSGFAERASRPGPVVLCVPAADQADEISARLLAAILIEAGARASTVREPWRDAGAAAPDGVVVSALPPEAVGAARRTCRQVRARWRDVPIVIGLWNAKGDLERARHRLQSVGAAEVVTSFAGCVAWLEGRPVPATGGTAIGAEPGAADLSVEHSAERSAEDSAEQSAEPSTV